MTEELDSDNQPYSGDEEATSELAVELSQMFDTMAGKLPVGDELPASLDHTKHQTSTRDFDTEVAPLPVRRQPRTSLWMAAAAVLLIAVGGIGVALAARESDDAPSTGETDASTDSGVTGLQPEDQPAPEERVDPPTTIEARSITSPTDVVGLISLEEDPDGQWRLRGQGCGVWTSEPAEWRVSVLAMPGRLPDSSLADSRVVQLGEQYLETARPRIAAPFDGQFDSAPPVDANGDWSTVVPEKSVEAAMLLSAECLTDKPLGGVRYKPVDVVSRFEDQPPQVDTPIGSAEQEVEFNEAKRHVENYLAALAAGAWEQAAWPQSNAAGRVRSDEPSEEVGNLVCIIEGCQGPFEITSAGLTGESGPIGARTPNAIEVTVRHTGTGETSSLHFGYSNGQPVVTGSTPKGTKPLAQTLVEQLFGADRPNKVVVERLEAFEIWNGDDVEWVTNEHVTPDWMTESSDRARLSVEGDYMALTLPGSRPAVVSRLDDPTNSWDHRCPALVDIAQTTLVTNTCESETAAAAPDGSNPIDINPDLESLKGEAQFTGWVSRGGTTIAFQYNAEGAVSIARTEPGTNLVADDANFVGDTALSADGSVLAYGVQTETHAAARSRLVAAKLVETGKELGRWELEGAIACLEASGDWIVVCEGEYRPGFDQQVRQTHLVAIHIPTGELTRVPSRARLFLPTPSRS